MPKKPAAGGRKQPAKPRRGQKLDENGVIYSRYSSHAQKDISIEQQVEQCTALAKEHGIRIIETYADRAVSGRTDKRPDFQRMMKDAASGMFRYVIAWKSNRIGRNMLEALVNEARLEDMGVRILYVEEDFDDTAAGRFAARSMMNVNQFYSENMAEDIRRGLYDNAANCMVTNGHLPFGYKADKTLHYTIDEPRAEVIREIFTRVAAEEPFVDIFDSLNARGITTSYGQPWKRTSLNKILTNERYRGVYLYGDVRIEGGIPRIVSDELFFKVQEVIKVKKNPQRSPRRKPACDYLLTGKIFCGKCKHPMTGISGTSRSGQLHYYYVCQGKRLEKICDKKNIRRDDIELQMARSLRESVLQDKVIEQLVDRTAKYNEKSEAASRIGLLQEQSATVRVGIKNIMAAIEKGIITDTTKDRLLELEAEQRKLEGQISAAKADIVSVDKERLTEWLLSLKEGDIHDMEYRKRLFDTFLIAVFVYDNELHIVFNFVGNKNTVILPLDLPTEEGLSTDPECSFKLHLDPPEKGLAFASPFSTKSVLADG